MNPARRKNRERYYYWEWFRHAQWINNTEQFRLKTVASSLTRILEENNSHNCLHYLSGFGILCHLLNQKSQKCIGYEISESAVIGSRIYASKINSNNVFFQGTKERRISETIPHHVSAVISTDLLFEQNWHDLKKEFFEIFEIITPGGLFAFTGANEHTPFASRDIAEFDQMPSEALDWNYKDGEKQCSKLTIKSNSEADYRDYKDLYIINCEGKTEIECNQERIPGYWNLHNLRNLVLETGFSHFEVRTFNEGEREITLNVAYKGGKRSNSNRSYSEEQAYNDF